MAVLSAYSVTLEVPQLDVGIAFYSDAGFVIEEQEERAIVRCPDVSHESIVLLGGADRKRLHHIALRADPMEFDAVRARVCQFGGTVVDAPSGHDESGLWVRDPHGMLVHLVDAQPDAPLAAVEPFAINEPGRIVRTRRSAMLPRSATPTVKPLRLGHILVFSPDVPKSVEFFTGALHMGLADHAQDIIAFCCARKDSDHHVVAFAKSPGVGFHHASFQVTDPDAVGRGGALLAERAARGQWGFGRHTIGSNFFHYIQDPWGSWFEYYSDMDHIDDYNLWTPTNYEMEDSLANWGPALPHDFVHNYEIEPTPFSCLT
ncbi:Glyoxalase/Bleomycin resistance protein/Dioxygenase superfamily protein [Sphingobium sp. AP50]|uniref:VOC family protein n=1 Tax=Sphingobium sp. AP50 TaxID=1884369 RepID=UPI0008D0D442|nr:VOC family protein [Sphingobium sp. AP50]SEK00344.1 Glyoxalase/Bleomycin resistance protein/Dioxygenase superfamily protein [Sphingobium sp. AP50]